MSTQTDAPAPTFRAESGEHHIQVVATSEVTYGAACTCGTRWPSGVRDLDLIKRAVMRHVETVA